MKINHRVKKGYLINVLRWNIYYKKSVRLILKNIINAKRIDLLIIFIQEVEEYDKELIIYAKKYLKRYRKNNSTKNIKKNLKVVK